MLVSVFSTWPAGHDVHVVDAPVHVWQLLLHTRQLLPLWYVPAGHVATQLVPFSSGVAEPGVQLAHVVPVAHVPHVGWQATQLTPFE